MASIEYMCRFCGRKVVRGALTGKPQPGNCPRKPKVAGRMQPHSWSVNRKF